jgi:hypothetical protein
MVRVMRKIMMPNNTLQRTRGHHGRPVLALNCALGRAELRSCLAAELGRYAARW